MLTVTIEKQKKCGFRRRRVLEATLYRSSLSSVGWMPDYLRTCGFCSACRVVRRTVVNHENCFDMLKNAADDISDEFAFRIRRDDCKNRFSAGFHRQE